MKNIFRNCVIMIILGGTLLLGISANEDRRKETNWQPISDLQFYGIKFFVDVNSISVINDYTENKVNSGDILFSYKEPTEILFDNKKITIGSVSRNVNINCSLGLIVTMYDIYFLEKVPTRNSIPIAGLEWPIKDKEFSEVQSKKSPLYKSLCPSYI